MFSIGPILGENTLTSNCGMAAVKFQMGKNLEKTLSALCLQKVSLFSFFLEEKRCIGAGFFLLFDWQPPTWYN